MAEVVNIADVALSLVNTGVEQIGQGIGTRKESSLRPLLTSGPHSNSDISTDKQTTDLFQLLDDTDALRYARMYWDTQGNLRWLLTKGNIYIHPQGGTGNGTVFLQTDLKVGDPNNPTQGGTIEHSGRINAFYDPLADKPALWLGSGAAPVDAKQDYIYIDSPLSSSFNFARFRKSGSDVLSISNTGQIVQNIAFGPLAGGFVATYGTSITATVNQGATASSQSFAYALNVQATTPATDSGLLGSLTAFNGRATHNSTGKASTLQGLATTADAHGPAGTLYGTFGTAYGNNPAGATVDTMNGAFGNVAMFSAGNVTAMYGVTGWVSFINNTGLATTAATFRSRQPQLFAGSTPPTNLYGLLIEPHTIGVGSWNLYSQGSSTRNYFEGQVGIGTSNPTAGKQLHVVGNTQLEGTLQLSVTGPVLSATGFQKPWNQITITTAQGSTPYGTNASPVGNYVTLTVPATDSVAPLGMYGTYTMVEHYGTALLGNPFGHYTTCNIRAGSGGATTAMGGYAQVNTDGSAPVSSAWGSVGYAWHNNAGAYAPSDMVGVAGRLNFFANDTRPSQAATFRAIAPRSVSAGLGATNLYGLLIDDHSVLSGTNNYNIYSLGASSRNYFQGQVGIGTSNPAAGKALHVVGDVKHESTLQSGNLANGTFRSRIEMQHEFTDLSTTTAGLYVVAQGNDATSGTGMALWGGYLVAQTQATSIRNGFSLMGGRTQATHNGSGTITNTYGLLVGATMQPANAGNTSPVMGAKLSAIAATNSAANWVYACQFGASLYNTGGVVPDVRGADIFTYADASSVGVTTVSQVYVRAMSGTGSVGTLYGLYMEDQTRSGTLAWNLYSLGATSQNYMQGQLLLGTTAPVNGAKLTVSRVGVSGVAPGQFASGIDTTFKAQVGATASGIVVGVNTLVETDATDTGTYQNVSGYVLTLNQRGTGKANLVRGYYASVFTQGYSGTQWGMQVQSSTGGAGYVDNLYGAAISVIPQGSSTNTIAQAIALELQYAHFSTQPVTTAYGLKIKSPYMGSSTVGTLYGVYIDDQTAGAAPSYNIMSKGATTLNVFEGRVTVQGALNTPTKTPTSSADASGTVGDQAWDDNYVYVKTNAGWKRAALSTF